MTEGKHVSGHPELRKHGRDKYTKKGVKGFFTRKEAYPPPDEE
jgi:hypothetical protein